MPIETTYLVSGLCIGLVVSFILGYKRLKELKSYIKNDEKMFDERDGGGIKFRKSFFDRESGYLIDVKGFRKIDLKENVKGLNAFYEDDWAVIKFHLEMNDVEEFLNGSSFATDRHIKIIREKIKKGEIVRVPQCFIKNEKITSIVEDGNAEIHSKEEDEKVKYLLEGMRTEDSAIMTYLCLPNGRVVCCTYAGSFDGMSVSDDETIEREKRETKSMKTVSGGY